MKWVRMEVVGREVVMMEEVELAAEEEENRKRRQEEKEAIQRRSLKMEVGAGG